jgi:hypothetical protein
MAKFIPALEYVNEEWAPITMECDQPFSSRKPKRCVTQNIRCGDTIRGNNKMGRDQWGSDFYRKATCLAVSSAGGHGGSEMVYRISVPKHTRAIAKLKSDCVDLDVFALRWNDRDLECPKPAHAQRVGECQADLSPRGGQATMTATTKEETYLIAVDGKAGAVGNFELTIACETS